MVIMSVLDVEAVRAFLAIADHQSFTRAAQQLGTTQGAISVKLKRLEDRLGQRLIERTPRSVRLSAQGAQFVDFARDFIAAHNRALDGLASGRRRFSLGIATHVAGPEVPTMLARLNAHDPALRMEVELDNSAALLGALDRGTIDAAILRRDDDRRDGAVLAPEPFGWYAAPDFAHCPSKPLRIASTAPSCGVRNIAARALDAVGIAWTEVFLGCSPLVADAVTAGLAVAVFATRLAPAGTVEVGAKFGLPVLPASELVLVYGVSDPKSRAILKEIAAAYRAHDVRRRVAGAA
jgi:DNA-binding transcriptional LysR family regulator